MALFVVSTHVLPHKVSPSLHETVHAWSVVHSSVTPVVVVHVAHPPAQQIPLVSHDVVSATLPVETQVGCPVLHDMIPVWHGPPGGVHGAPATHEVQDPPTHTPFVPHTVPSAALPVAVHID